jgi:pimeloyl-ACP methyl ester carboxylesterase
VDTVKSFVNSLNFRQEIMPTLLLLAAVAMTMPATSPTGVANQLWQWRGFQIRYQCLNEEATGPACLLVHGLFVNADHWRRNLPVLADAGFRVYAIDLLGSGYSSKPYPTSSEARAASGENGRPLGAPEQVIGSASGQELLPRPVPLAHPVEGSVYNFYTWAEQLADFTSEVIGAEGGATLVANSIGTISALQAAIDRPELFRGVFVVNPNFRELHAAEQPGWLRPLAMPLIGAVQRTLRERGQPLFDLLANPSTVKTILKEPYHDDAQVTDELVDVLLAPLLSKGAADVVFDTLSYSAGPLPEPLLSDERLAAPVMVLFGEEDPWTPPARVRALERYRSVRGVIGLPGVGHCPHDEAPELVNPLIIDFVRRVAS